MDGDHRYVTVVKIVQTFPVKNPEIHRTSPWSSPSPSDSYTYSGIRGHVVHTVFANIITTVRLGVRGSVMCDDDHYHRCLTRSVWDLGVHRIHPFAVVTITTV